MQSKIDLEPALPAINKSVTYDPELTVLQKQAAAFVTELAVCNRHTRTYPAMHPIVSAALEKALELLAPLTENGKGFTLGIARHAFMVDGEFLERQNVNLVGYAALLSELGIITLTFSGKLQAAELHRFNLLTGRPRDEVWEEGGVKRAFAKAGIMLIEVQGIDPSFFSLSENISARTERKGLWERLLHTLLDGRFPIPRENLQQMLSTDPVELADTLNSLMAGLNDTLRLTSIQAVAITIAELAHEAVALKSDAELLKKLVEFVTNLSPQLRRDFLSTFLMTSRKDTQLEEQFFERLPDEIVIDTLNATIAHSADIPQLVLKLMHRLTTETAGSDSPPDSPNQVKLEKGLQVLLRQDEFEKYVPVAYQAVLAAIIANDRLGEAEEVEIMKIRETLQHDLLEVKTADVIAEILRTLPLEEQGEGIQRTLAGLAAYFLNNGDFRSLARTCAMVNPDALQVSIVTPRFVTEVFNGLAPVRRDRLQEVHDVIIAAGRPFVVPLMERLAVERSRPLRRFYFDCLHDLGNIVRDAALERLQDDRWFFVRNLLVLLRAFPDHEVQRAVHRFMDHPHSKVRYEALKNIVQSHDPMAERFLLQELECKEEQQQIAAVQLAETTRSQAVIDKLFTILNSGGIEYNLELKRAIVTSLSAIGDILSLPRLEEILRSHNLFHPVKHSRLKREIVNSLARYPAAAVSDLIEEFGKSGQPRLSDQIPPPGHDGWNRNDS